MKRIGLFQVSLALLLVATIVLTLVLGGPGSPAKAKDNTSQPLGSGLNAIVYIATASLKPLVQSGIDQQVPAAFSNAINNIVGSLPKQDQGWVQQMATALISPSATLLSLVPQQKGIAVTLSLRLYPGDPKPTIVSMLVMLSVANPSSLQVSVQPLNGGPALVSGRLETFNIPLGQLNSVFTTPGCGGAAFGMNLQFPVSLAQAPTSPLASVNLVNAVNPAETSRPGDIVGARFIAPRLAYSNDMRYNPSTSLGAFIEIPASALVGIGSSIGSLPVSKSITAKNIQLSIQGQNLVISSDIYWGSWFKLGTAKTMLAPQATGGGLTVHVASTSMTIFNFITFPYNSYNQQIEQMLDSKLNSAFQGQFTVSQATIGPTSQLPCAKSDSLVLSGTTNLG